MSEVEARLLLVRAQERAGLPRRDGICKAPVRHDIGTCSLCVMVRSIYDSGEIHPDVEKLYERHLLLSHGQTK